MKNRIYFIICAALLFAMVLVLPVKPAYCETNEIAGLTAQIDALLELNGEAFFAKREAMITKWKDNLKELSILKRKLTPIRKAVVGGIIARASYPDLMKELDERHLKALETLADPPVIYRDMMGKPFPGILFVSTYLIDENNDWKDTHQMIAREKADFVRKELKKMCDDITLPNNKVLFPFLLETIGVGFRFSRGDSPRREIEVDKNFARWKATVAIRNLTFELYDRYPIIPRRIIFPHELLLDVCQNTDALDSPGFFKWVTNYAYRDSRTEYYQLLATPERIEMVKSSKILGDPNLMIPDSYPDCTYKRFFAEVVKYAKEHPTPTPTPILTPTPTSMPDTALEDEDSSTSENLENIKTATIFLLVLIVIVLLVRKKKG